MIDPDDLGPADEKMLNLLRKGRVTAPFTAEETGYSLQYTRVLGRLVDHSHAEKVHTGLYELVDDPRHDETIDVSDATLRSLRAALRALENNGAPDVETARAELETALEELDHD
jgi:hypothetical protein